MTQDGRLCGKEMHNLKYLGRLNREMPEMLRQKGWQIVDDCNAYDSVEEQKKREEMGELAYREHRKELRSKRGRESAAFKSEVQSEVDELQEKIEISEQKLKEINAAISAGEKKLSNIEKKKATAEQKLKEINAQYDEVNKGLKKILDMKATAAKVPSLNPFSETVNVHRNTWDGIKEIGDDAYNRMKKANQTKQEAVAIQQRAERKEKEIEPLYQQASAAQQQAEQEYKRNKALREQQERLIEEKAEVKATEKVGQIMQGTSSKERDRMRMYMESLKFNDGTTALEHFEEQERQLQKKLNRGLHI